MSMQCICYYRLMTVCYVSLFTLKNKGDVVISVSSHFRPAVRLLVVPQATTYHGYIMLIIHRVK